MGTYGFQIHFTPRYLLVSLPGFRGYPGYFTLRHETVAMIL
jgi:hypothetical protein